MSQPATAASPIAPATEASDAALRPVDPRYRNVLRVRGIMRGAVTVAVAAIVEAATPLAGGALLFPALFLLGALATLVPARQYARWGFHMSEDRLRVAQGLLFRSDAVVPFGRVQHIDVRQGPLERAWQLGSLTLFTAGTHNASVTLPGLPHADALAMREAIRARIHRDTM